LDNWILGKVEVLSTRIQKSDNPKSDFQNDPVSRKCAQNFHFGMLRTQFLPP
jgi:hypothetical protein